MTGFEPTDLRTLHGKFVTGVTVVTTTDDVTPYGLTLNAFSSLTLDPPLIMVSIQTSSATYKPMFSAKHFAVNILAADQEQVARTFASKRDDKFSDAEWAPGLHGSPILDGATAWLEAETTERVRVGTHTLFVGRVCELAFTPRPPLVYAGGAFFDGALLG